VRPVRVDRWTSSYNHEYMPEPAPGEARTPLLSRTRIIYYTSFATDLAYFTFLFSLSRWLAETGAS